VNTTLVATGAVFVAAAIVGKGLEGAGIKIPALDKGWQHFCLAGLGILVIAIGALPQLLVNDTPVSQPTMNEPGATPFSAASSASSGPSATAAPSSVQLVNLSTVATQTDGYSVGSATVDGVTYQNALVSNGDICSTYGTVTYQPARRYKHFHALVGVTDDSQSDESVDFSVTVDNDSSPSGTAQTMNVGEAPKPIDVDIAGAFRITLSAVAPDCVFNGTAVWINPVLSE
jgi:NPCBM/NEW2 domain